MKIGKIAVIGAGDSGHAMAADLTLAGFDVTLYEMHEFKANIGPIITRGGIEITGVARTGFAKISKATSDIADAIKDASHIMVVTQTLAHETVAELCAPHLKDGHRIMLFPGSGGTLQFAKTLKDKGVSKKILLAEALTCPYACRRKGPALIHVHRLTGPENPAAALPATDTAQIIDELKPLYPALLPAKNVLEAALYNPNNVIHAVGVLLNAARIEFSKGDFWLYREGITPAVWTLLDAVDKEKKAVLEKLGLPILSYNEMALKVMGVDFERFAALSSKGPSNLGSRYVTEDVPMGMVFTASLGELIGVDTPNYKAIIKIFSAISKVDYWEMGRTAERVGIAGMGLQALKTFVEERGRF